MKSAVCPGCGQFTRRTKEGRFFKHVVVTSGETCDYTGEIADPGLQMRSDEKLMLAAPSDNLLEMQAREAVRQVEKAWRFIWQQDPPDNLGPAIRAQILGGANATLIVGAVTIAAQRRNLDYDSQWVYACGIVRNSLAARHLEEL